MLRPLSVLWFVSVVFVIRALHSWPIRTTSGDMAQLLPAGIWFIWPVVLAQRTFELSFWTSSPKITEISKSPNHGPLSLLYLFPFKFSCFLCGGSKLRVLKLFRRVDKFICRNINVLQHIVPCQHRRYNFRSVVSFFCVSLFIFSSFNFRHCHRVLNFR